MELEFLRTEVNRLKSTKRGVNNTLCDKIKQDSTQEDEDAGSENQSEASEEDEYIDDLPQVINQNKQKGPRTSVSAEAFGNWNKKTDFVPPFYEKSAEVKAALKKRLEQAFMFSALNP